MGEDAFDRALFCEDARGRRAKTVITLGLERSAAVARRMPQAEAGSSCSLKLDRSFRPVEAGTCVLNRHVPMHSH